jgi:hypothetical protein
MNYTVYACYVTSSFLDIHARPERVGFDIQEFTGDLFSEMEINMSDIRNAIITSAGQYLNDYLKVSQATGRARIERFVS